MDFSVYLPFWSALSGAQQAALVRAAQRRSAARGTLLRHGPSDCLGLVLILSGQLRAYLLSGEGREITLYRLFERDICLFSASCMMKNIQFDVTIEAEKDTDFVLLPPDVCQALTRESAAAANYINEIMGSRFSQVMWLMEQVLWTRLDQRLAAFLLEESTLEEGPLLSITHEKIANHLGTAREVVTRMLRYFQGEGLVKLTRGAIEITAPARLRRLSDA